MCFASPFCARAFGFTISLLNFRIFTYYLRSRELVLGYLEGITGFIDTTNAPFTSLFAFAQTFPCPFLLDVNLQ